MNGDKKLEFTYDCMGRRVRKKVYTYDGSEWDLTADLRFVYHNWLLLVEYEGAQNTKVRKYVWGLDLSSQRGGQTSG